MTVHQMEKVNSFRKEGILRDRKLEGMNRTVASVLGIYRSDNTFSNPCPRVGKRIHCFRVLMIQGEYITVSFLLSCLSPTLPVGYVRRPIKQFRKPHILASNVGMMFSIPSGPLMFAEISNTYLRQQFGIY